MITTSGVAMVRILCSCYMMSSLAVLFAVLVIATEASAPVRACPNPDDACVCNARFRSVVCKRMRSLTTRLPVGIPVSTKFLTVSYSALTRLGPNAFRNCHLLEEVNLRSNRLEEISPYAFQNMEQLHTLLLANNRLKLLVEDTFTLLKALRILDLSNNQLIVLTPRNFAKLSSLQKLDLRDNPTMCISPTAFAELKSLEDLKISNMKSNLNKDLLSDSPQLSHLTIKSFSSVNLISEYFFKNNKKLQQLIIEDLPLLGNDGISDALLTGQKKLVSLTLSACRLTSIPKMMLERVKWSLKRLDLSKNPLMALHKDDLVFLQRLQILNLRNTGLLKIEKYALAISSLHTLDLSGNGLTFLERGVFGTRFYRWQNLTLGNNPWICDCTLRWVVEADILSSSNISTTCAEPRSMQSFDMLLASRNQLRHNYFPCTAPNITEFGIEAKNRYNLELGTSQSLVSLSASCVGTGYPKPEIRWVFHVFDSIKQVESDKKQPIQKLTKLLQKKSCFVCETSSVHQQMDLRVDKYGTITLNQIPPSRAIGIYTCIASSRLGDVERSFTVTRMITGREEKNLKTSTNSINSNPSAAATKLEQYQISSSSGKYSNSHSNVNNINQIQNLEQARRPIGPLLDTQNPVSSRNKLKLCTMFEHRPLCGENMQKDTSALHRDQMGSQGLSKVKIKTPVACGSKKGSENSSTILCLNSHLLYVISLIYFIFQVIY